MAPAALAITSTAGSGLRAYHAGLWTVVGIAAGAALLAASGLLAKEPPSAVALAGADTNV